MADGDVTPFRPGGSPTPPPPGPPGAGGPPGAAAGGTPTPPGGLPTGISPAMQDTGRQGLEMQARIAASVLASRMGMFAGLLGLHSDIGKALHQAAGILAKAVPAGSIPEGAQQAMMQKFDQMGRQNTANVGAMRQMGGGPAAGAPGMPPPSAPRPPQMPNMAMAA